jgi:hypothetical protein
MELKFIQKSEPQRYILGTVYSPDDVDCQGDYSNAKEIEKACHGFMRALQGQSSVSKQLTDGILKALSEGGEIEIDVTDVYGDIQKGALGYNHLDWDDGIGDIVESYIAPADFELNGEQVKKGTWLMGVILSPEKFEEVQKGALTGFSMGGSGNRIPDEVKKKMKPKWRY